MNRTADFWDQVRSIKRKQSLPMETREETRPTLSISPFLRDALKLVFVCILCNYRINEFKWHVDILQNSRSNGKASTIDNSI